MSTQSITRKTKDSLQEDSEKRILENANNYFLNRDFSLGNGEDYRELKHSLKIRSFICTKNCELNNFIESSILEGSDLEFSIISTRAVLPETSFLDYTDIFEQYL